MQVVPNTFPALASPHPVIKKSLRRKKYLTPEEVPEQVEDEDGFPNYFANLSLSSTASERATSSPLLPTTPIKAGDTARSASATTPLLFTDAISEDYFAAPLNNNNHDEEVSFVASPITKYSSNDDNNNNYEASPVARKFWSMKKEKPEDASPVTKRFWLRENLESGYQKLRQVSKQQQQQQHSRKDILKQINLL